MGAEELQLNPKGGITKSRGVISRMYVKYKRDGKGAGISRVTMTGFKGNGTDVGIILSAIMSSLNIGSYSDAVSKAIVDNALETAVKWNRSKEDNAHE